MIDQTRGTMVTSGAPGNPQLEREIIRRIKKLIYEPLSVLCTVQRESEKNAWSKDSHIAQIVMNKFVISWISTFRQPRKVTSRHDNNKRKSTVLKYYS